MSSFNLPKFQSAVHNIIAQLKEHCTNNLSENSRFKSYSGVTFTTSRVALITVMLMSNIITLKLTHDDQDRKASNNINKILTS